MLSLYPVTQYPLAQRYEVLGGYPGTQHPLAQRYENVLCNYPATPLIPVIWMTTSLPRSEGEYLLILINK